MRILTHTLAFLLGIAAFIAWSYAWLDRRLEIL